MPIDNMEADDSEVLHYLKAISMFDAETDFGDEEAKRQLSLLFRELIMSDDPKSQEFFTRFLSGVDKVIKDMGIIDSNDGSEEVNMPEPEQEPTQEPTQEPNVGDLEGSKRPQPTSGPGSPKQPPVNDNYDYLLNLANSYIYM